MNEELNFCPKCGKSDLGLMRIQEVQGIEWYQVSCESCGKVAEWGNSVADAIASWNEVATA